MSKFCLILVDFLAEIGRFFYRKLTIFQFNVLIWNQIVRFYDRNWHIFLTEMINFPNYCTNFFPILVDFSTGISIFFQ